MECHPLSGPHMISGGRKKDYRYGVVDTKQMCCMSTSRGTSILQLQRVSRKKTNLKKEKYTHLLGDQETSASQTVTRGLTVSLGRTNDGLVLFAIELAPAAGSSWCMRSQEKLVWLVSLYIVLLLLFPGFTTLVTGVLILSLVGIF